MRKAGRRFAPIVVLALLTPLAACQEPLPAPPETRRGDFTEMLHGVAYTDPYHWLEDQEAGETRDWIAAQNEHTERILALAPAADDVRARLEELYRVDTISAPLARGGRYFTTQRRGDQDLSVLHVRRSLDGTDEVVLDPHRMSADGSLSADFAAVSADGTIVAYSLREGGQDEVTIHFMNVDSGEVLDDILGVGRYFNVSISPDLSGVYYDLLTEDGPRVFFHPFSQLSGVSSTAHDTVVFGRGYGRAEIILSELSSNGRYLLISVLHGAAAVRTELYFRDLWTGDQVHTIVDDIEAAFEGHIAGDTLFVLTNWDAPNRRVFAANLREPAPDSWTEVIPEGDTPIQSLLVAGGRLLVQRLENVQPEVTVYEPDGFPVRDIAFPEIGTLGGFTGGAWESDELFFTFSSLARPPTIYRYRISDGDQQQWAATEVPVEPGGFEIRQVRVRSRDGTEVPMFLAHRAGVEPDGARPTLLTGYGGFNVSVLPGFNRMVIAWMEKGGVWAISSLRGGGELGEEWHRAGMLENKQNVFDDFIAAAEWLVANDYTRPSRLAIRGDSNGGLLVGAALTQRPDLFGAVVCAYPLLDMLRYHKFLVAGYWVPEYGSSEDPVQFEYLAGYSPYHRVVAGAQYPAVMLTTGDGDTRVAPLHARKMTALLQAQTGSGKPILLRYDTMAGHSGGRPLGSLIDARAAELRFLLWQLDVE